MAEYTIKIVDVAAEAHERLGGDLARAVGISSEPDWRYRAYAPNKSKRQVTFANDTHASMLVAWLEANGVKPDEQHYAVPDRAD